MVSRQSLYVQRLGLIKSGVVERTDSGWLFSSAMNINRHQWQCPLTGLWHLASTTIPGLAFSLGITRTDLERLIMPTDNPDLIA